MSQLQAARIPHFVADKNGKYKARRALTEDQIIKAGKAILQNRIKQGAAFTNPNIAASFFDGKLHKLEHEVFACLFLDSQHRKIKYEELFRGTIDGASVYPREVVKRALELNAKAVIFAHNHPSGIAIPSDADRSITKKLKQVLEMFDITVLDHFIVGSLSWPYSFASNKEI